MMDQDLDRMEAELTRLMHARLGLRGASLDVLTRRAGRSLPRAVRRDLASILRARALSAHPRLVPMVDGPALRAAAARVAGHLRGIDPKAQRFDRLLGLAGVLVFNLVVVALGVLAVLAWRGFL